MELETAQGYQDPCVRQIGIFLQNQVGELGDVLRHLQKESISVHAISVTDSVDFAVVRLIVDRVEDACEELDRTRLIARRIRRINAQVLLQACHRLLLQGA